MPDIETPEELETFNTTTPQYPYSSIGAFYKSLRDGISAAGVENFPWTTTNQLQVWSDLKQTFPEVISSYDDAVTVINVITEQGEGKSMSVVPLPPFVREQFPIPPEYQLQDPGDPSRQNSYSHFGRFVDIKNNPLPDVYPILADPTPERAAAQTAAIQVLQHDFASLIASLTTTWVSGADLELSLMDALLQDAVNCWQTGAIPQWIKQ